MQRFPAALTFFFLYGNFLSELAGQRILNAGHVGLIAFAPLLIIHRASLNWSLCDMDNGNYRGRIAVDPQIHFGKPCVAGTRIPVVDVLELVREGISFKTIRSDYFPDLQEDDIRACIHYAIDVVQVEDIHISEVR